LAKLSETLDAIDAPTRPLVVPLFVTYSLLVIALGLGVWRSVGRKRALRFVADLLVGKEVLLVFGALAGLDAPRFAANLPTPWAGVAVVVLCYR
jgi:hypothetical protein